MKLPRLLRPILAGGLLLASQVLEDLGRRIAPKDDAAPPPRPRRAPPQDYSVTLSPTAQAMIAPRKRRAVAPAEEEPLAGSLEARRRAGELS